MDAPGDDRLSAGLRAFTAELARIIDGDLDRPVPACPGWTFRQLATHLGRGHRWAAQIVATRATAPVPVREVADGKLPEDPARHASWLNAGAEQVIEAVAAVGSDLVWTMTGLRPAGFWTRRRAHEAAVHLADAQLAAGRSESVNTLLAGPPPGAPVPPILPPAGGFLFLDRDKFHASFAGDLPAEEAAFMAASQVPWGVDALSGTVTKPAWRAKPSWYLLTTEDKMIAPAAQRSMAERAGATVIEVAASHSVYVSQPAAVADLITQARV